MNTNKLTIKKIKPETLLEDIQWIAAKMQTENIKLKAINDSLLNALKDVSDAWRGVNDIYLPPFQKATLKKVNDILISIQKQSNE